jgi:hypothetical protein
MRAVRQHVLSLTILLLGVLILVVITGRNKERQNVQVLQAVLIRDHAHLTDLLQKTDRAYFDCQRQLISAQQGTAEVKDIYQRDREELSRTQKALAETQRALTNVIEALRQAQTDVRNLAALNAALAAPKSKVGGEPPPSEQTKAALECIRSEIHQTHSALAESTSSYQWMSAECQGLVQRIADTHLALRREGRDQNDITGISFPEISVKPFSTRSIANSEEANDELPGDFDGDKNAWFRERLLNRSGELERLESNLSHLLEIEDKAGRQFLLCQEDLLYLREGLDRVDTFGGGGRGENENSRGNGP